VRRLVLLVVGALTIVGCTGGSDDGSGRDLERIRLPGGGSALRADTNDYYRRSSDGTLRALYTCTIYDGPTPEASYTECFILDENGERTNRRIDPNVLRKKFDDR
jgi:hypothetical protein